MALLYSKDWHLAVPASFDGLELRAAGALARAAPDPPAKTHAIGLLGARVKYTNQHGKLGGSVRGEG